MSFCDGAILSRRDKQIVARVVFCRRSEVINHLQYGKKANVVYLRFSRAEVKFSILRKILQEFFEKFARISERCCTNLEDCKHLSKILQESRQHFAIISLQDCTSISPRVFKNLCKILIESLLYSARICTRFYTILYRICQIVLEIPQ